MVLKVEFAGGVGTDVAVAVAFGAAVIAESVESPVTVRRAAQASRSKSFGQHQGSPALS
jgi:hypothetical protein